jgi:DNA-directed RNA polymerase subunit H (RpoH/RPB5)
MHVLQPKQKKIKPDEVEKLLQKLNISLIQLPKIRVTDPSIPQGCEVSDILEIERTDDDGKKTAYYRVVSV